MDRRVPGLVVLPDGLGEIGSTGHDQRIVMYPDKGTGHAQGIRKVGQGFPMQYGRVRCIAIRHHPDSGEQE